MYPVDEVLDELVQCLDHPALPLLQWNEEFSFVEKRLPEQLAKQLEKLVSEHADEDLAGAALDGRRGPQFPGKELVHMLRDAVSVSCMPGVGLQRGCKCEECLQLLPAARGQCPACAAACHMYVRHEWIMYDFQVAVWDLECFCGPLLFHRLLEWLEEQPQQCATCSTNGLSPSHPDMCLHPTLPPAPWSFCCTGLP
jgi:hypothetical protein